MKLWWRIKKLFTQYNPMTVQENLEINKAYWDNHYRQARQQNEIVDTNLRLIATIREMDQLIWTMGQQPTWERMRPYFQKLEEGTICRRQIENTRIRTLMLGEIKEAYNTDSGEHHEHSDKG